MFCFWLKMKFIIYTQVLICLLAITGCANYAQIEQLQMGMTTQEVAAIAPDCTISARSWETSEYKCRLNVPKASNPDDRTINPYILKFKNDRLQEITLDEKQLDRDNIRYRTSIGIGYGSYRRHYLPY